MRFKESSYIEKSYNDVQSNQKDSGEDQTEKHEGNNEYKSEKIIDNISEKKINDEYKDDVNKKSNERTGLDEEKSKDLREGIIDDIIVDENGYRELSDRAKNEKQKLSEKLKEEDKAFYSDWQKRRGEALGRVFRKEINLSIEEVAEEFKKEENRYELERYNKIVDINERIKDIDACDNGVEIINDDKSKILKKDSEVNQESIYETFYEYERVMEDNIIEKYKDDFNKRLLCTEQLDEEKLKVLRDGIMDDIIVDENGYRELSDSAKAEKQRLSDKLKEEDKAFYTDFYKKRGEALGKVFKKEINLSVEDLNEAFKRAENSYELERYNKIIDINNKIKGLDEIDKKIKSVEKDSHKKTVEDAVDNEESIQKTIENILYEESAIKNVLENVFDKEQINIDKLKEVFEEMQDKLGDIKKLNKFKEIGTSLKKKFEYQKNQQELYKQLYDEEGKLKHNYQEDILKEYEELELKNVKNDKELVGKIFEFSPSQVKNTVKATSFMSGIVEKMRTEKYEEERKRKFSEDKERYEEMKKEQLKKEEKFVEKYMKSAQKPWDEVGKEEIEKSKK